MKEYRVYNCKGDKYVDPASRDRQYNNEKKKKMRHEAEFKPASGAKTEYTTFLLALFNLLFKVLVLLCGSINLNLLQLRRTTEDLMVKLLFQIEIS